jgi:hypothetical protein
MFLISQLVIPVAIPLFTPIFSLAAIIGCSIVNLVFLLKIRTVKFYICIYYRILSQISFIIFNSLFAVYYVIEEYFPATQLIVSEWLGYISIGSMIFVMILELV